MPPEALRVASRLGREIALICVNVEIKGHWPEDIRKRHALMSERNKANERRVR